MDLQEIRMRCLEAVATASEKMDVTSSYWSRKVVDRAKELEVWVLNAEEDALKRLGEA